MNNNRGSSRRRGRGSNRQQGGQPLNRIDSRARGNAPQLLEKYRKMAHDAHLNGDRVTEEYNLQFADHYFRVIADQKQRQEEARQNRQERGQDNNDSGRDENSSGPDTSSDKSASSNERNETDRRERNDERRERNDERNEPARASQDSDETDAGDGRGGDDAQRSIYEPQENPFTRGGRGLKPRRTRRDSRASSDDEAEPEQASGGNSDEDTSSPSLDPASLPPSISGESEAKRSDSDEPAEAKPRRRSTKRSKPSSDDGGEPLEAVN